ncbi:fimbrial protein [Ewingella sp. S1.OA.A_B6]
MKFKITTLKTWLITLAFMVCSPWAHAVCFQITKIGATGNSAMPQSVADQGYTAASWGGVFNAGAKPISFGTLIMGTGAQSLAPAGTVLASADLPFISSALVTPYAANQIVIKCALADANELYEMYTLNAVGGAIYGGQKATDIEGGYVTPATGIAYRIMNTKTGLYYTSYWQQRQLTSDDYITEGSSIYIKASAFSDAHFELLKTADVAGVTSRNAFGQVIAPQGLVVFKGGLVNSGVTEGALGGDKATYYSALWSMRNGSTTIIRGNTCTLGDFDQVVQLPPISVGGLRDNGTSTNTFNVAITCDSGAVSGTTTNTTNAPVAMGFLVTQAAALAQASTLGLQTGSGGISYLLDDNYGATGVASGVGIRIYGLDGTPLNLLSSKDTTGTGSSAGWYGFAELLSETGDTPSGGKTYGGTFTASLEQIPGLSVQAGSINAQAQIIVSLQ